jgi:signal transduction histidine kinase
MKEIDDFKASQANLAKEVGEVKQTVADLRTKLDALPGLINDRDALLAAIKEATTTTDDLASQLDAVEDHLPETPSEPPTDQPT